MRTRSSHLASPASSSPTRAPSTRKRAATNTPPPFEDEDHVDEVQTVAGAEELTKSATTPPATKTTKPITPAATPRRNNKRVRFSDPGAQFTTGLTPRLRRSTLSPGPSTFRSRATKQSLRRTSMPPTDTLPTSSSSPLFTIEEQQFTPLKQALDERIKRRLRRNHLSEEINEYEYEHRAEASARHELEKLKEKDMRKEERIHELELELELQRQFGIEINEQEEAKQRKLQQELAQLREGLVAGLSSESGDNPMDPESDGDDDITTARIDDDGCGNVGDVDTPWEEESFFSSPSRSMRHFSPPEASTCQEIVPPAFTDAFVQAELADLAHEARIQTLEQIIDVLKRDGADARTEVIVLRAELLLLGFSNNSSDAADTVVAAIREGFRLARVELEHLLPGETTGGLDNGKVLLQALVKHLGFALEKLREKEKVIDKHHQFESASRNQFNCTLQKLEDVEKSMSQIVLHRAELIAALEEKDKLLQSLRDDSKRKDVQAEAKRTRISELETKDKDSTTSIERLRAALQSYRDQVISLEKQLTELDEERFLLAGAMQKNLDDAKEASELKILELEQQADGSTLSYETAISNLKNDLETVRQERAYLNETFGVEKEQLLQAVQDATQASAGLAMDCERKDSAINEAQASNVELKSKLKQSFSSMESYIRTNELAWSTVAQCMQHNHESSKTHLRDLKQDSVMFEGNEEGQEAVIA